MKLNLTDHLESRLKLRGISEKIVEKIFKKQEEFYWDNLRKHHIVVSKVTYKGKLRKMLAAYDKRSLPFSNEKRRIEDEIEVITTHPVTDEIIKKRLISGRWTHEKT